MLIEARFEGGLADQHKVPAYDGAKSLEGITRSILIVANFLVEGRVRRRDFGQVPLTFNMVAQRPGSFETIYELAYAASVIGAPIIGDLAGGVAGNLLTDLLRTVYRRVTGSKDEETASVQELEEVRSGDIGALVDAVEPAVRMAHNVINYGVINININQRNASDRISIAEFDPTTKRYMYENIIDNEIRIKLFSIGSFNANQGSGRAFDLDEGRSIPFELAPGIDRTSVNTILGSINSYAMRRRLGDNLISAIAVQYTCIRAVDGRLKKMRVLGARPHIEDFLL